MPHPARRPRSRAALLLVALLTAVFLGGMQERLCAKHGVSGMSGAAMTGHAAMAGMSHHAGSTDSGGHGGCCTCIGECSMVAPLGNAPTAATLLVTLVAPEPVRPLDVELRRPPTVEPDRRLPFANGPPASALV